QQPHEFLVQVLQHQQRKKPEGQIPGQHFRHENQQQQRNEQGVKHQREGALIFQQPAPLVTLPLEDFTGGVGVKIQSQQVQGITDSGCKQPIQTQFRRLEKSSQEEDQQEFGAQGHAPERDVEQA